MMLKRFFALIILSILPGCVSIPEPQTALSQNTYFDTITIELVYTERGKPSNKALTYLTDSLVSLNLTKSVRIIRRQVVYPRISPWTTALIRGFEGRQRVIIDRNPQDRHLKLFVAYLPDFYMEGNKTGIAGLQYDDSSFAIFIGSFSRKYEGSILLHEFGHIVNLVDIRSRRETPANPERPSHCNNTDCVMFWRVGGTDSTFDSDCLRDLRQAIETRNPEAPKELLDTKED